MSQLSSSRLALPQPFRLMMLAVIVAGLATLGFFFLQHYHAAGLPGDLDGNGVVNQADLSILRPNYRKTGTGLAGDINGDGKVNAGDLSLMVQNWGGGVVATTVPMGFAAGAGIPTHKEMDAYKAAGADFVRFGFAWDSGSSKVDGNFDDTQAVADAVAYANSIHLGVILQTGAGPTYGGHMFSHNVAFAHYVANVAAYFNGTSESSGHYVWAIEVGNETNLNKWDRDVKDLSQKAADYADLMIRIYDPQFENVKARTTRPVIIAGIARTAQPLDFTKDMFVPMTIDGHAFSQGIKGHYDGWTFHPYDRPNTASQDLARGKVGFYDMVQVMNWFKTTFGSMPPVYITEYGQQTYPENATTTAYQVKSLDSAVYQLTRQNFDVRVFTWFEFMDRHTNSTISDDHMGVVDETTTFPIPDSDKKSAYAEFYNIATTHTVPITP